MSLKRKIFGVLAVLVFIGVAIVSLFSKPPCYFIAAMYAYISYNMIFDLIKAWNE